MTKKTTGQKIRDFKKMDDQTLSINIAIGSLLMKKLTNQVDKDCITSDLGLLKDELKRRGYEAIEHEDFGLELRPIDLKVSAPVAITIPSVDELINGKTATDLPKHGYLTTP